jgi:SAM-dependent methyltransferase
MEAEFEAATPDHAVAAAVTAATSAAAPALHPDISAFYDERFDEIDRLGGTAVGRLERERTMELLLRVLPPAPARVLDVGGGPGVYAARLAALGYRVTLVDPVPRHLEQAAAHGTFAVEQGDARSLTAADASADAVLLLGPLYHLVDPADRAQALREAVRAVRPGGLIAAAFISRTAPLIDISAKLIVLQDEAYERLQARRHNGVHQDGAGFTLAYFHTLEEIGADFAAAGLAEPEVLPIEGPLFGLLASGLAEDRPEFLEAAHRAARLAEGHASLTASTSHLFASIHTAAAAAPTAPTADGA